MNRKSSFTTDKHQAAGGPNPRHRMDRRWEPILTEDKLKVALAEREELRATATELERKLNQLRARRLARGVARLFPLGLWYRLGRRTFSAFVFLLLLALLFLLSHQLSRFSAPRSMLQSGKAIDRTAVEKATLISSHAVGLFPDPVENQGIG